MTASPHATQRPQRTEKLLAVLGAHPGATAADAAAAMGLGRSTTAALLATLASEQLVERTPGGREAGRRLADRWALPAPGQSHPGPPAAVADQVPTATIPAAVGRRLGRGQLAEQVADYLRAHPGEHSPVSIAQAVGAKSAGAVGNALGRLVEAGQAVRSGAAPRRYRGAPAD